jgi:hypothetical protein
MIAFDARNRIYGGGEAYVSINGWFDGKIPPPYTGCVPRLAFISSRWVQVARDSWADGGRAFIRRKASEQYTHG